MSVEEFQDRSRNELVLLVLCPTLHSWRIWLAHSCSFNYAFCCEYSSLQDKIHIIHYYKESQPNTYYGSTAYCLQALLDNFDHDAILFQPKFNLLPRNCDPFILFSSSGHISGHKTKFWILMKKCPAMWFWIWLDLLKSISRDSVVLLSLQDILSKTTCNQVVHNL